MYGLAPEEVNNLTPFQTSMLLDDDGDAGGGLGDMIRFPTLAAAKEYQRKVRESLNG